MGDGVGMGVDRGVNVGVVWDTSPGATVSVDVDAAGGVKVGNCVGICCGVDWEGTEVRVCVVVGFGVCMGVGA